MRSSDGTVRGATIVFRDISETERARAALKRSEEMFRAIVEKLQEVVLVLERDGTIRYVSPNIENMVGYLPEELITRSALDLLHPEDVPRVLDVFLAGVDRPDSAASDEFRVRHKNGSWRFAAAASKNQLENPEIAGIVITVRDVTERIRAEEQALFHTTLLDQVRSAVFAVDTEGRIIYWNSFACKLFQWTPEEVLGKNIRDVAIPPSGRSQFDEVRQAVGETGYFECERPMLRRDGTTFPALQTVAAVRDRLGHLIGYVGVAIDVTERKEVEERLRAFQEQLRELAARNQSIREAERTRIARDIHDELGQQLTALKMDLFHMAKDLSSKADCEKLALNMKSTIGLVDSTIQSVQRISSELRPGILDHFGIAAAIEWQLQEFRSRTRIRCTITRPEDDVPLQRDCATAVFRIFQEVLTNIARHANASAVRVVIQRENGHMVVTIRDNGKGITKQQIAAPGSLGLLGMRERALHWGGELTVRGDSGKGTLVSLRIPIAKDER
jgi:PAS domain S-box-containing protein